VNTYTSTEDLRLGDERTISYLPDGPQNIYHDKYNRLIVQKALDEGLPEDTNGIYLIFPSEDIREIDVSNTRRNFIENFILSHEFFSLYFYSTYFFCRGFVSNTAPFIQVLYQKIRTPFNTHSSAIPHSAIGSLSFMDPLFLIIIDIFLYLCLFGWSVWKQTCRVYIL
jgi:hypothetical protein